MEPLQPISLEQLESVTGGANGQWLGRIGSFLQQLGGMFGQQPGAAPGAAAPGAAPAAGAAIPSAAGPAGAPGAACSPRRG